ncbi:helix-turn-helix transcriptional regulator [Henriciella aquimarina]|uniref:helix-turn-helix transcriptional regulator n=1 Tax=Henriciella aquimarina TaxID=545261 RepID=UPI0009FDD58C|nr:metalloregulator ArsR/SmtB family transcription factor [Henriciella aquimarina]
MAKASPPPALSATRNTVLDLLKRGGPQSAGDLAEELGVTPMAVRLHLYELAGEGLIEESSKATGRGRPTKIWSLTEAAARAFPDAHQGLALEMIESIREMFGEEGLEKVIDRHSDSQLALYREKLAGLDNIGARVKRLTELRSVEGYMAVAAEDGKDWLLIENHCPICSAARACTRLCANELDVFRQALGPQASVVREDHLLAGARRCVYRVSEARAA